jgi:hypothetical protein
MTNLNKREGECAGLYSGEIHDGITEAGRGRGGPDAFSQRFGDGPQEVVGGQFDPGDVIVMADPQVGEAHPPQSGFDLLDLTQLVRGDRPMVRYPGREARRGGFVRAGQLQSAGDSSHIQFCQAGVGKRP